MNSNDSLMKHFVLSLAAAIAVMTSGLAQCMADFDFGDAPFGISPDPALDETFAEGTVGTPYADTLHILMPTLASDLGGDFDLPIAIDSMVVQTIALIGAVGEMLSIQDLDLTLTPNNNGDSPNPFAFLGGNQYCATISGTPNAAGVFTASISVLAYTFGGFEVPYEFEGFTLTINPMPGAGCTNSEACNYDSEAINDDGSCLVIGEACDDMDAMTLNDTVSDACVCEGDPVVEGCTSEAACNYNADANTDDGSCLVIGEACDDNDPTTVNYQVNDACQCVGEVDNVLEMDFELSVYPNPTMGELIIKLPVGHAFDLTMMSLSGQTVHSSQTIKGGAVVWQVSDLPAGAYLLHVRNEQASVVRRVLVSGR